MASGRAASSWTEPPLGEVALVNPKLPVRPSDDAEVSFIPMKAVQAISGQVDLSERRVYGRVKQGYTQFIDGDILFAKITPCMENGKVAVAERLHGGVGCGTTEFHVLRLPLDDLPRSFFFYYLVQEGFRKEAQRNMTGSAGQLRVPKHYMEEVAIPLPPLAEQHQIVGKVEELFTRLDAGVEALKKVQVQLRRYRQAVLRDALTGKLTQEWRERELRKPDLGIQSGSVEVVADRLSNALRGKSKGGKLSPVESLPELPQTWCYTGIGPLLSSARAGIKTGPFGSLLKKHEHRDEGVPVLGIENIEAMRFVTGSKIHITQQKADALAGYDVQAGDVLISRSGTVGEVCVVPEGLGTARFSTNIIRVSLAREGVLPRFFCMLFSGCVMVLDQVRGLCKGSTRDFLNQRILRTLVFPLPSVAEQQEIVAEVDRHFSVADAIEQSIEQTLRQSKRLRQSILKRAFEGKLTKRWRQEHPELVTGENSAEKLLERIKAEKAKLEAEQKATRKKKRKTTDGQSGTNRKNARTTRP